MLTSVALVLAGYCVIMSFRLLTRALRRRSGVPWRRLAGYSAAAIVSMLAAIFVCPAIDAGWKSNDSSAMPKVMPLQQFPDYGDLTLQDTDWDTRLEGTWSVGSDERLLHLSDGAYRDEVPNNSQVKPSHGTASLLTDGDGNQFLKLDVHESSPGINLYATSFGTGEPTLLPLSDSACYAIEYLSDSIVALRNINYPYSPDLDFFVNAGVALHKQVDEENDVERERFRQLIQHLESFAVDGRLPVSPKQQGNASGIEDEAAKRDAVLMNGYWLPSTMHVDGNNVEAPAVYRFLFYDKTLYQWTSSPYDFQASYFKLDASQEPSQFEFHFSVNGRVERLFGIYQVSEDVLTLCWSTHERPTEFETRAGDNRQLLELQRLAR